MYQISYFSAPHKTLRFITNLVSLYRVQVTLHFIHYFNLTVGNFACLMLLSFTFQTLNLYKKFQSFKDSFF